MPAHASGGRLGVYALTGALAGVLPLPILPRRILRMVRGAMAHDVCAHHGVAMTGEAREVFAEPTLGARDGKVAGITGDALTYVGGRILRRFSPLATVYGPLKNAWETMTLGHLLDRYLTQHRVDPGPGKRARMEVEEAMAVRRLLDRAAARAFKLENKPDVDTQPTLEEHRDPIERALDTVLISAASLPASIATRLDAALDALIAEERPAP